jgi:hypothetical protein
MRSGKLVSLRGDRRGAYRILTGGSEGKSSFG